MKKLLLGIGLFFLCQNLVACKPNCFAIQGEFLCWKPHRDAQFFFNTTFSITGVEDVFVSQTSYHPDFRVVGEVAIDPSNTLEGRFTYFNSVDRTTVSGVTGFDLINFSTIIDGTSTSELKFQYYAADLILKNCNGAYKNFFFTFIEGLHSAWINYRNTITSVSGAPGSLPINGFLGSRFWAIGPEFGLDLKYPFFECLAFVGNVRGSLLINNLREDLSSIGTLTRAHQHWLISPAFDARLGFDWNQSFRCFHSHLEIGYEFVWYRNATELYLDGSDSFYVISFDGPYLALGIDF